MDQIIKQLRQKRGDKLKGFLVKGQFRQFKSSVREVIQFQLKFKEYCYMFDNLITSLTLLENYVKGSDYCLEMCSCKFICRSYC